MVMRGDCDGFIYSYNIGFHQNMYQSNDYLRKGEYIKANDNICDLIQPTRKT